MKNKVQVYQVIPKLLEEAVEALGLSKIMKNKAYKLVCIIIKKGMQNNHDLFSYVPMPANYLMKTFNKDYHKTFFNNLKHQHIIECNEDYKQGSKAYPGYPKGYRINPDLLDGNFVSISYTDYKEITDDSENFRINTGYSYPSTICNLCLSNVYPLSYPSTLSIYTPVLYCTSPLHISSRVFQKSILVDDLSNLFYDENRIWKKTEERILSISSRDFTVDDEIRDNYFEVNNHINSKKYYITKMKAIEWCQHNGVTLIQDGKYFYIDDLDRYITQKKRNILLNYKWYFSRLKKGIFYCNRNHTNNRLDHNLTSISKDAMSIIKEDNDLVEIDIKNSQFAIHANWLKREGLCEQHPDVDRYYQICTSGTLYEELTNILNVSRKEAKQMMMGLAFSKAGNQTSSKAQFKNHFPNVIMHIDSFKRGSVQDKMFSIELQKIEAWLIVDNLYPNIKEQGLFCLTKHDSLIVRKEELDSVLAIVNDFFKTIGFMCTLAVDVG